MAAQKGLNAALDALLDVEGVPAHFHPEGFHMEIVKSEINAAGARRCPRSPTRSFWSHVSNSTLSHSLCAGAVNHPQSAKRTMIVHKRIMSEPQPELGDFDWTTELAKFKDLDYPEYYTKPFHSVPGARVHRATMFTVPALVAASAVLVYVGGTCCP